MIVVLEETHYFDDYEREKFKSFLKSEKIKQYDFAKKCGITPTYLSEIIMGHRVFSKKVQELFEKNGYEVNENE